VARVQPNWSGEVLDLVVDFVTYVFVPAYAITASGLLLPLAAPILARRLPPLATLIFGPAVSVIAAGLFLAAPSGDGFAYAAAGHFLVGFGPMLWLICQVTVRQLVCGSPMNMNGWRRPVVNTGSRCELSPGLAGGNPPSRAQIRHYVPWRPHPGPRGRAGHGSGR